MIIDPNFAIIQDDLSGYLSTRSESLLKEDMLQLEHGRLLIDVGFYGSEFVIFIVEDHNWDEPMVRIECRSDELEEKLAEACRMVLDYELALAGNMGLSDEYAEFFMTIRDNNLHLIFVDGERKAEILDEINRNFVSGDPRALWTSLKHPHVRLGELDRDPYWRLREFIDDERTLYFIIDIDNYQYAIYKGSLKDIHTFIGDCECLDEYYLMSTDGNELWCATDHDELLYVSKL